MHAMDASAVKLPPPADTTSSYFAKHTGPQGGHEPDHLDVPIVNDNGTLAQSNKGRGNNMCLWHQGSTGSKEGMTESQQFKDWASQGAQAEAHTQAVFKHRISHHLAQQNSDQGAQAAWLLWVQDLDAKTDTLFNIMHGIVDTGYQSRSRLFQQQLGAKIELKNYAGQKSAHIHHLPSSDLVWRYKEIVSHQPRVVDTVPKRVGNLSLTTHRKHLPLVFDTGKMSVRPDLFKFDSPSQSYIIDIGKYPVVINPLYDDQCDYGEFHLILSGAGTYTVEGSNNAAFSATLNKPGAFQASLLQQISHGFEINMFDDDNNFSLSYGNDYYDISDVKFFSIGFYTHMAATVTSHPFKRTLNGYKVTVDVPMSAHISANIFANPACLIHEQLSLYYEDSQEQQRNRKLAAKSGAESLQGQSILMFAP